MVKELFSLAKDEKLQKKILDELNTLFDTLLGNSDYITLLDSASITNETKLLLIDTAFSKHIHPYVLNFIKLLATHQSMHTFFKAVAEYESLYISDISAEKITVTSAMALSSSQRDRLAKTLQKKYAKEFFITYKTDKKIISGLIIDFFDKRLDFSIKSSLERMH